MAATNEQIQQAVESFFLLFNGVIVFCKLLYKEQIQLKRNLFISSNELWLYTH